MSASPCDIEDRLSIVVVTSPLALNPDTRLIDAVINSFNLVHGLQECPLIIVADGVKLVKGRDSSNISHEAKEMDVDISACSTTTEDLLKPALKRDNTKRSIWKRGKVLEEDYGRYLQYCENLRKKYCSNSARRKSVQVIGPLERHHSFAHALRVGLEEVKTDLVLVVQHDRAFMEKLSIIPIISLFDQLGPEGLRYVGFQSRTNHKYPNKLRGRFGEWANCYHLKYGYNVEEQLEAGRKRAEEVHKGLFKGELGIRKDSSIVPMLSHTPEMVNALKYLLIPVFYWYDSNHVCRTQEYIKLINEECKLGQFIETTYGVKLEKKIEELGKRGEWTYERHLSDFGCFLYWDWQVGVGKPIILHLNGRMFMSEEDRKKNGWELAPAFSKYSRLARLESGEAQQWAEKRGEGYETEIARINPNIPKVKDGLDRRQRLALRMQFLEKQREGDLLVQQSRGVGKWRERFQRKIVQPVVEQQGTCLGEEGDDEGASIISEGTIAARATKKRLSPSRNPIINSVISCTV